MADDYIEKFINVETCACIYSDLHFKVISERSAIYPFGNCNQHGRIGVYHLSDLIKSDVLYQYVLLAQERILNHCSKAKRTEFKAVTRNLRLVISSNE